MTAAELATVAVPNEEVQPESEYRFTEAAFCNPENAIVGVALLPGLEAGDCNWTTTVEAGAVAAAGELDFALHATRDKSMTPKRNKFLNKIIAKTPEFQRTYRSFGVEKKELKTFNIKEKSNNWTKEINFPFRTIRKDKTLFLDKRKGPNNGPSKVILRF